MFKENKDGKIEVFSKWELRRMALSRFIEYKVLPRFRPMRTRIIRHSDDKVLITFRGIQDFDSIEFILHEKTAHHGKFYDVVVKHLDLNLKHFNIYIA